MTAQKISAEEIEAARTPHGGFTKKTLAGWGVPWPPPSGWKKNLIAGNPITLGTRKPEYFRFSEFDWVILMEGSAKEEWGSAQTQQLGFEVGPNGAVGIHGLGGDTWLIFDDSDAMLDQLQELVDVLRERRES